MTHVAHGQTTSGAATLASETDSTADDTDNSNLTAYATRPGGQNVSIGTTSWRGRIVRGPKTIDGEVCYKVQPDDRGAPGWFDDADIHEIQSPISTPECTTDSNSDAEDSANDDVNSGEEQQDHADTHGSKDADTPDDIDEFNFDCNFDPAKFQEDLDSMMDTIAQILALLQNMSSHQPSFETGASVSNAADPAQTSTASPRGDETQMPANESEEGDAISTPSEPGMMAEVTQEQEEESHIENRTMPIVTEPLVTESIREDKGGDVEHTEADDQHEDIIGSKVCEVVSHLGNTVLAQKLTMHARTCIWCLVCWFTRLHICV